MNSGIPAAHIPFWEEMSIKQFYSVYKALSASPTKVLQLISDTCAANPQEEKVISYLRQYVGNMQPVQAQRFLRFVTGSCVCSGEPIMVQFNQRKGFTRRPESNTCSRILFLSRMYNSYEDFKDDIDPVLSSPSQWYMDYR